MGEWWVPCVPSSSFEPLQVEIPGGCPVFRVAALNHHRLTFQGSSDEFSVLSCILENSEKHNIYGNLEKCREGQKLLVFLFFFFFCQVLTDFIVKTVTTKNETTGMQCHVNPKSSSDLELAMCN